MSARNGKTACACSEDPCVCVPPDVVECRCDQVPCVCHAGSKGVAGYRLATEEELEGVGKLVNLAIRNLVHAESWLAQDDHEDALDALIFVGDMVTQAEDIIERMAIEVGAKRASRCNTGLRGESKTRRPLEIYYDRSIERQVRAVMEFVAREYDVPVEAMLEAKRGTEKVCWARHVAMFLARELTVAPLEQLAELFRRRDHSSIANSVEHVRNAMDVDPLKRVEVTTFKEQAGVLLAKGKQANKMKGMTHD